LYGKTGTGKLEDCPCKAKQHGWFIGWIEKNNQQIVFAEHLVDSKKEPTAAGARAKAMAEHKLLHLISSLS
jgi:beta-lactamase class D